MTVDGVDALRVYFRAAAGPRVGFGHVVRCRSLARALGVAPRISLRATARTRIAAERLGVQLEPEGRRALAAVREADVMVVDDPSPRHADVWVQRARRAGVPVATVHDLGLGYVAADLGIDGSVRPDRRMRGLRGPGYAMLDPRIVQWRARRRALVERDRVLIALGGGNYVFGLASSLADAIAAERPSARIRVAAGFARGRLPALSRAEWVTARDGLAEELSRATVALVAGGVTAYEACALGVPAVAVALTRAQGLTVRALAGEGAVIDGGPLEAGAAGRAAHLLARLAADARTRRRLALAGQALVDGRGVFRVADEVRALTAGGRRAA